jgi:phosphate starvation-inducible PhoH-like protein
MSLSNLSTLHFALSPESNTSLATLCGQFNTYLRLIEAFFGIEVNNRGHDFELVGPENNIKQAQKAIELLFSEASQHKHLSEKHVRLILQSAATFDVDYAFKKDIDRYVIQTPKLTIKPRTPNQLFYIKSMYDFDINFGIGPAGTGKTYLATAFALAALQAEKIRRIVIVRPVVEAGEHLGFLPGDIAEKVNPYLRPIYDSLYDMHNFSAIDKLIEKNIIEIAPLAFMRGRTLNDAIIILDEAQNTTIEQMKMLLTRIGFNSKAIITGDITQIDLTHGKPSGLKNAIDVLKQEAGIGFTFLQTHDVIRHTLVQKIINAYQNHAQKNT